MRGLLGMQEQQWQEKDLVYAKWENFGHFNIEFPA